MHFCFLSFYRYSPVNKILIENVEKQEVMLLKEEFSILSVIFKVMYLVLKLKIYRDKILVYGTVQQS